MNLTFRSLEETQVDSLLSFCDNEIGKNYFNRDNLLEGIKNSQKNDLNCSFAVLDQDNIVAMRLTYAPGTWFNPKEKGYTPEDWGVDQAEVAYFKSLFVNKKYQQHGLGSLLSNLSVEVLKRQGAKAVLCHSSMNSPNNSSQKYLNKFGFKSLKVHSLHWNHIDYSCTHCHSRPCTCSGMEMIYIL